MASILAWFAGTYLVFCNRTTRWQVAGLDALKADLAKGPILIITWHGRTLMGPLHWPVDVAPLSSLHDASPIGRVSGALQKRMGLHPIRMTRTTSNRAASREVLRRVRQGVSIGMTGDGPVGPPLQLQDAALEWARITGMPVYSYAFATSRSKALNTWDNMILPKPFAKGAFVFGRWTGSLPRDADAAKIENARAEIEELLNDVTDRADKLL